MLLDGLADFARSIHYQNSVGFYRFRASGVLINPNAVSVAVDDQGAPQMRLQMVRPMSPFSRIRPHAILNLVLAPQFDFGGLNRELIDHRQAELIQPVNLNHGQIQFVSPQSLTDSDLLNEFEMSREVQSSLGHEQLLVFKMSPEAGAFWKQLISDGQLLLDAKINYLIKGVSPRIQQRVIFNPRTLIEFLQQLINQQSNLVKWNDLVNLICQANELIPATFEPIAARDNISDQKLLGEAFADRIFNDLSKKTCLDEDGDYSCELALTTESTEGRFEWDLSIPTVSHRATSVAANPFDVIANRLSDSQKQNLIQEIELPLISGNKTNVAVHVNAATAANSTLAVQTVVSQPPEPPQRPVAFSKTLNFDQRVTEHDLPLHKFSNGSLEYQYQTKVVIESNRGIIENLGKKKMSREPILVIGPDDFDVTLVVCELDSQWLETMSCSIELSFDHLGTNHTLTGELSKSNKELSFYLPALASNINTRTNLYKNDQNEVVEANFANTRELLIGPYTYPQCGMQEISIEAEINEQLPWAAVELSPVPEVDETPEIEMIQLTKSTPKQSWRWFNNNPFSSSYRFRELNQLGNPKHDWKIIRYPFPKLILGNQ